VSANSIAKNVPDRLLEDWQWIKAGPVPDSNLKIDFFYFSNGVTVNQNLNWCEVEKVV